MIFHAKMKRDAVSYFLEKKEWPFPIALVQHRHTSLAHSQGSPNSNDIWKFLVLTGVQSSVLKHGSSTLSPVAMVSHNTLHKQLAAIERRIFVFPIPGSKGNDKKIYTVVIILLYKWESSPQPLENWSKQQFKKQTFLPLFAITS